MKTLVALTSLSLALASSPALAQLVFSTTPSPVGVPSSVFEQRIAGGPVTPINSGFSAMNFASLSRDGRTILFSSPDPTGAVTQLLPSSDLYSYDRTSGLTSKLIDNQTQTLQGPRGIQVGTTIPEYNAISPDGRIIVASNRITLRDGNANPQRKNDLDFYLANGTSLGTIETGRGTALDLLNSEFIGISWAPDSQSFVTSAYILIQVPGLGFRPVQGIVRYSSSNGRFVRSANLSTPRLFSPSGGIGSGIQIFPAISPSGNAIAYFDITFPDSALLTAPATARLIVSNIDGSGATERAVFNQGFYPLGLTWAADGSQLIFSIAPQLQSGRTFSPIGNHSQAVIRAVAPFGGNFNVVQLPGISAGFLPNLPGSMPIINPPTDLSRTRLSLLPASGGNSFTLRAPGLDPSANYILESSSNLSSFGNPQTISGQNLINGFPISKENQTQRYFRIRNP